LFVSRNRISCLFRAIIEVPNFGTLCFASPPSMYSPIERFE
jgi:hypothetical protein